MKSLAIALLLIVSNFLCYSQKLVFNTDIKRGNVNQWIEVPNAGDIYESDSSIHAKIVTRFGASGFDKWQDRAVEITKDAWIEYPIFLNSMKIHAEAPKDTLIGITWFDRDSVLFFLNETGLWYPLFEKYFSSGIIKTTWGNFEIGKDSTSIEIDSTNLFIAAYKERLGVKK